MNGDNTGLHPVAASDHVGVPACAYGDTFSNEHGVVGLDGRLVDIGSCRGAGGFIAKLNHQTAESKYDYVDFKMKAELKKIHREAIEDSKEQPVPAIVLAYQNVYDTFPHDWPPWEFDKRRGLIHVQ